MRISHDYSYISGKQKELIKKGYGEMSVRSLSFDRYFTEEQKQDNFNLSQKMTNEEWGVYCDNISKSFNKPLKEILDVFVSKYNIHQVSEETSTIEHYRSNWDLFFWSNEGWNEQEYMDYFKLEFNKNRSLKENMEMLTDIIKTLENLEYDNIYCRIQYDVILNDKKIKNDLMAICDKLATKGKFIEYANMIGKIKVVKEVDSIKEYGFFKKGARKHYYTISGEEILTMNIED